MTAAQAQRVFAQLRAQFATQHPAVWQARLVVQARHFLARPKARDLAWYEPASQTVNLVVVALRGPFGRVAGLLAHELGHASDPTPHAPYAERRADALAAQALGQPVLYDRGDVQNLDEGTTPRPSHLPESRRACCQRNPRGVNSAPGLYARMDADGADTFAKKVRWVQRHIPDISDPQAFVGWVVKAAPSRRSSFAP